MDARSALEEIVARWEKQFDVSHGAFQITLEGPNDVKAYVVVAEGKAAVHDGVHPAPIGSISMPLELLLGFMQQAESFDLRLLPPEAQQAIRYSGDPSFLVALTYLIRQPNVDAVRRARVAERLAGARPRQTRLERRHRPSIAEVVDTLRSSTPMIVTGVLDGWSIEAWTFDRLATEYGSVPITSVACPAATLGQLIELVRRDTMAYTNGCLLPAELSRVFEAPFFARDTFIPQLWMGLGPEQQGVTHLHRDLNDSFLAQIVGKKRVQYYSPDQAAYLYPHKNYNTYQPCWVDPSAPDWVKYPLFKSAEPIEVILSPGEVLINPAGWFHCVYTLGPTMSVSFIVVGDAVHSTRDDGPGS
jgi:hypothetical protein